MKKSLFITLLTGALSFIPAFASAATITVVHGINGLDLGLARELPVEIAVNGSCALSRVTFGASTRVELAQGTYTVTVHPATTGKCTSSPVINQKVTVPSGAKNVGLVAQLTNSGTPQLQAFLNDGPKESVIVNNAAKDSKFSAGAGLRGWIFFYGTPLENGMGQNIAGFGKNGRLQVVLIASDKRRPFYKRLQKSGSTLVLYVVGSTKNGQVVVEERIS